MTEHKKVLLNSPDEVRPYVHQVFPTRSPESFEGLKESIREKGILEPIYLDHHYAVLDGHHRVKAWIELLSEGVDIGAVHGNVLEVEDPFEARQLAYDLNNSRQLNPEEKRSSVAGLLKDLAERYDSEGYTGDETRSWDNTRVARKLGFERGIVVKVREALEDAGEIPVAKKFVLQRKNPGGNGHHEKVEERGGMVKGSAFSRSSSSRPDDEEGQQPLQITTPDGEILEAETPEDLQAKLEAYLKEENKAANKAAKEERTKLEESWAKELAEWLETWRNPEEAPKMANVPVEVWEQAIKKAKSNRHSKVEQLALKAAMNASPLKEYEPEEVIEHVLQSDMRDLSIADYEFAADWYGRAVEALKSRQSRPVQRIK